MKAIEIIQVGYVMELGSYTFEADDIIGFARQFDPQRFHLSEEEGKKSLFGALAASGWHTAAIAMSLFVKARQRENEALIASGQTPLRFGPSPGVKDIKWPAPVLAGDTVTYRSEVIESRPSASKPGCVITRGRTWGVNQNGVLVYEFTGTGMVFLS
jgi:acyl dehydratase